MFEFVFFCMSLTGWIHPANQNKSRYILQTECTNTDHNADLMPLRQLLYHNLTKFYYSKLSIVTINM